MKQTAIAFLIVLFAAGFGSGERVFAPSSDLWDRWETHDEQSTATVDHSAWDAFLKSYLSETPDGVTRVAYGSVLDSDKAALNGYLDALAGTAVSSLNRDEQMAYWLNMYNALTVKVILDHYPVDSIKDIDISPGLFSSGPWGADLIEVEGEELSLNDVEHRILRPIWNDPRIHYGVNCASIGCPDLLGTAFTSANLDTLLDEAGRAYVNDPRGVTIQDGKVTVSRIYDWFIEDFGNNERGVLTHLIAFSEADQATALTEIGGLTDTEYDWSLNDAP